MRSHQNFLFTAISVFRILLPFCTNAVTAVFSNHVVESWHDIEEGGEKMLVKISSKRAIVIKITKRQ